MNEKKVSVTLEGKKHEYEINVGSGLLDKSGSWTKELLPENTGKIAVFSNEKVFGLYGEKVCKSLEANGFTICVWLMDDGEEYKNFDSLQKSLKFLGENKLKRTDAVIALGGGVIGDLTGFAASIYLRGIKFLQIPTTLLSMMDSSVGGKTAVNTEFGKNLIGTFYQPEGVLIDIDVLQTLENREVVAGFCEAVKQGAVGSRKLFDETAGFLKNHTTKEFQNRFENEKFKDDLINIIFRQIEFKAEIVMQDEQESVGRQDAKSRKILNFGHTTAHALEKITDYKYFKHGEAVGYGILVAAEISKKLDLLDNNSINLLNDVVYSVGDLPIANSLDTVEVFNLFA